MWIISPENLIRKIEWIILKTLMFYCWYRTTNSWLYDSFFVEWGSGTSLTEMEYRVDAITSILYKIRECFKGVCLFFLNDSISRRTWRDNGGVAMVRHRTKRSWSLVCGGKLFGLDCRYLSCLFDRFRYVRDLPLALSLFCSSMSSIFQVR